MTLKGTICDVQDVEYSQSGNPKRAFDLVDHQGYYISCCAMKHNAASRALQNLQEAVVYFGSGRGPKGNAAGIIYLNKDSLLMPIGRPRELFSYPKTHHLSIMASD